MPDQLALAHDDTPLPQSWCHTMKFNVLQAAKLYGKPRKTLYRHMASGRLAYSVDGDSGRTLDMSELIRVYGEPPAQDTPRTHQTHSEMSHLDTPGATPPDDPAGTNAALLAELRKQTATIERMSQRIERLEETMRTLPAPDREPQAPTTTPVDDAPVSPGAPRSMADVLARFESRTLKH